MLKFTCHLLCLALTCVPATASDAEASLAPTRQWVGQGRSMQVDITLPQAAEGASLLLLDSDGKTLERIENVTSGQIELGERLPGIWSLDQAAWLQLVVDGQPMGSPLVVVPLLDRPTMRTVQERRPDGRSYTKIVGWGDRLYEGIQRESIQESDSWKPARRVARSGLHVYPEMDVVMETSAGDIRLAMAPEHAPRTAWHFTKLVEEGFYDETIFHRVVHIDRSGHPFVIQGGDPTGRGDGGTGGTIPMEPSGLMHDFGVISMAREDDPDSAGTQYFICLSRMGTRRLDGQYCGFGWAIDGVEPILTIAESRISDPVAGRPAEPPVVRKASLVPAEPFKPGIPRIAARVRDPLLAPPRDPEQGRMPR